MNIVVYICSYNRPELALGAANSLKKYIQNKFKIILVCGLNDKEKFNNPIYDDIIETGFLNARLRRMGFQGAYADSLTRNSDLSICIDDDIRLVQPLDLISRYIKNKYMPSNTFCVQAWKNHKEKNHEKLEVIRLNQSNQCSTWDNELCKLATLNYSEKIDDVWLHIDKGSENMIQTRYNLINYVDNNYTYNGPVQKIGGPGTELKKILAKIGITASPTCSCNARAKVMDNNGIEWCENNIDTIVGWLKEESNKRGLPFLEYAGKLLVKRAIKKAKKSND